MCFSYARQGEDFDETAAEQLDEQMEGEDELCTSIVDAIGFLIKFHGRAVYPHLRDQVIPFATSLLDTEQFPQLQTAGLCVLDDIVEFCSPDAHELVVPLLPYVLRFMASPDPTQRQSAVYGAGVLAEHGGDSVTPHAGEMAHALLEVIEHPEAREDGNEHCADNAASALRKLVVHRAHCRGVDVDAAMNAIREYLPLRADAIEAREMHHWFLDSLASREPALVGNEGEFISHCLFSLAQAIGMHHMYIEDDEEEALFSDEDLHRIPAILTSLEVRFPHNA